MVVVHVAVVGVVTLRIIIIVVVVVVVIVVVGGVVVCGWLRDSVCACDGVCVVFGCVCV